MPSYQNYKKWYNDTINEVNRRVVKLEALKDTCYTCIAHFS